MLLISGVLTKDPKHYSGFYIYPQIISSLLIFKICHMKMQGTRNSFTLNPESTDSFLFNSAFFSSSLLSHLP